jgi:hypothetical protein
VRDDDPLYTAILMGDAKGIRAAVKGGGDLNRKDSPPGTENPLWFMLACSPVVDTTPALLRLALDLGADLAATNNQKSTALHEVCSYDHGHAAAFVKILVERGAPLEAANIGGETPLLRLCSSRSRIDDAKAISIARVLVGAGAKLEARSKWHDEEGFTPLLTAIDSERTHLAAFLIAEGAAIDAMSEAGKTALGMAIEKGASSIEKALRKKGATIDPKLEARDRFFAAGKAENWKAILAALDAVRADFPGDWRVHYWAARACSETEDWLGAEKWARRGLAVEFIPALLSILLYALVQVERFGDAIAAWEPFASKLEPAQSDADYALSHLMVSFIRSGQTKRAWEIIGPIADDVPHPNEAFVFNVACLASIVGAREEALVWISRSREQKPRGEFDADSDFDALRDDPTFVLLLERDPKAPLWLGAHLEKKGAAIDIVLREQLLRIGDEVRDIREPALAIDAYLAAVRDKTDFRDVPDPAEAALARAVAAELGRAKIPKKPAAGLTLEWNGAGGDDSHYEVIVESGKDEPLLSDVHLPAKECVSPEGFARVTRAIAKSAGFKKLKRKRGFVFVHQTHDAGDAFSIPG